MPIPVVWSPETRRHEPMREVWVGVPTEGTEVPQRVDRILDALAGHDLVGATAFDDDVLLRVHAPAFVDHLRTVHAEWMRGPYDDLVGQDRVVPYVFPTPAMSQGMPVTPAAATHGRAGQFGYDTMTLVGPGTWEAARAAVDCSLTAVALVTGSSRRSSGSPGRSSGSPGRSSGSPGRSSGSPGRSSGSPGRSSEVETTAYALCRPPGHHATRDGYGGSCYLNNAAVAAQALRDAGHGTVAVVDLDAHHGNGTQAIFWERRDVRYGSLHVDPGAGWFPHFFGHAHETGAGDGEGATRNLPLAEGTGDGPWLEAVRHLADFATGAEALVVSLGVDAAADDPESPLQVTADGYAAAGRLLGALGLPGVVVQEGGYHLDTIGGLVAAYLDGHEHPGDQ
jgi:acetoin utilization deacetylase AcuC-like enzyme